jgi:hypothetical protein
LIFAVLGAALALVGLVMAIFGRTPLGRSELPPRSVRLGGVAYALFGTSFLLHALNKLVGPLSGGLRLAVSTVRLGCIPVALGLFILAGVTASRDRRLRETARNALGGER